MKKFVINCNFGGQMSPFTVCIGQPEANHHPLHFQADWLSKERGGSIPPDVMDSISKLVDLAKKYNVSLEELCVYALGSGQQQSSKEGEALETSEDVEDNSYEENNESNKLE